MSRFFAGQRVRVVGGRHTDLIGLETRITGAAFGDFLSVGYEWVILVRGEQWGACSEHLEPITPPHVAGSWEVIEQFLPNIREGVAA